MEISFTILDDGEWAITGAPVRLYFERPGRYLLRASITLRSGEGLHSVNAPFEVIPYSGIDAKAYTWLKSLDLPQFLYDFDVYAHDRAHPTDDQALELIERFPESRFAPRARLFLAQCYLFGLRTSRTTSLAPDFKEAEELVRQVMRMQDLRMTQEASELMIRIKASQQQE